MNFHNLPRTIRERTEITISDYLSKRITTQNLVAKMDYLAENLLEGATEKDYMESEIDTLRSTVLLKSVELLQERVMESSKDYFHKNTEAEKNLLNATAKLTKAQMELERNQNTQRSS